MSLLGPLLLPTQFTAIMLAASGIGRARILCWQALVIIEWTTIVALIATGVIATVRWFRTRSPVWIRRSARLAPCR